MPPPVVCMSSAELLARPADNPTTYDSAIDRNENVLNKLAWVAKHEALYNRLWEERRAIDAITRHHVGKRTADARHDCAVEPTDKWLQGGFNVCIPVRLGSADGGDQQSLLFRCPLPYKLGEEHYPGTTDEKLGCEVGAYIWMQENCPNIRIPHLYGFGFSDGRQFTHASHCPWYIRAVRSLKRIVYRLMGWPIPSFYVPWKSRVRVSSTYMLLERITPKTGRMLALTWDEEHVQDRARRRRLFGGMARIILSLARIPQPRIGAFRFHDDGTISLTNRPFTNTLALMENDGAPRFLQSDATYTCTEPYVSDMLTFHQRSFLSNPNATHNERDCQTTMAIMATLRTLAHRYIRRESRHGPFVLQHTDLNGGNLFVDPDWNVTCLLDLEWVCALPVEKLAAPSWLTGRGFDELDGELLADFDKLRQEFMLAFEQEENMAQSHELNLSRIMRETWESGGFWFWIALSTTNGMTAVTYDHIVPRFTKKFKAFRESMHQFWGEDCDTVIQAKLADYKTYKAELREVYGVDGSDQA